MSTSWRDPVCSLDLPSSTRTQPDLYPHLLKHIDYHFTRFHRGPYLHSTETSGIGSDAFVRIRPRLLDCPDQELGPSRHDATIHRIMRTSPAHRSTSSTHP
ncbi:BQ5605_C024g09893 [Microbotryum silenes-dioicae]|uniref:BQ5605_C024g09893 protein n=1 Tax=Microbotryum silenes-dioicae TaxID=796604 RepID=A0A2X0MQM7_9BASI|nr:BQ5605_C024g09893 [Microbotryum silenes-dioicae]